MSTPAAAIPAITSSHKASCVSTISCPWALKVSTAAELTMRAATEITSAPSAALILVDPSFKQIVHVATDTPESIAKRIADGGTCTSLRALGIRAAHVGLLSFFCIFVKHCIRKMSKMLLRSKFMQTVVRKIGAAVRKRTFFEKGEYGPSDLLKDFLAFGGRRYDMQLDIH